jgi:glycosyltransferase involved in cell wall biosynthesis
LWQSAVSVAPLHLARGVQNKVLEALGAGLPVVVSSAVFEGLPDVVRPACAVGNDDHAFAAEVIKLLAVRPDERRAIARSAGLDQLSWPRSLQDLPRILTGALATQTTSARI